MRLSPNTVMLGKCSQVAALPWRLDESGEVRVLLVTSRTNRKWMLPKGWPMAGKSAPEAALIEAMEEAGVSGSVSASPAGSYHYIKMFEDGTSTPAQALIYPVRVTLEQSDWQERGERERRWCRPRKAAKMVFEPDLARFLADLAQERILLF